MSVLTVNHLSKSFQDSGATIEVLKNISLTVEEGEAIAVIGPSGSGKTTLLQLLGGLDVPDNGDVIIDGKNIASLSETQVCKLRNQKLGFIYQFHHLLPEFTALENVMMPLLIGGCAVPKAKREAEAILNKVNLGHRIHHKPAQLSGGERQRTAIARALITKPLFILADEPTGNLDSDTAEQVYELIFTLKSDLKTAFIIATHDLQLAQRMDRIIEINNGSIMVRNTETTITDAANF